MLKALVDFVKKELLNRPGISARSVHRIWNAMYRKKSLSADFSELFFIIGTT